MLWMLLEHPVVVSELSLERHNNSDIAICHVFQGLPQIICFTFFCNV